jgi:hypothetical protein
MPYGPNKKLVTHVLEVLITPKPSTSLNKTRARRNGNRFKQQVGWSDEAPCTKKAELNMPEGGFAFSSLRNSPLSRAHITIHILFEPCIAVKSIEWYSLKTSAFTKLLPSYLSDV